MNRYEWFRELCTERWNEVLNYYINAESFTSNHNGMEGQGKANVIDARSYTKYCVNVSRGTLTLEFSLDKARKITGYTFITADDTATFASRNPDSWTIYGSNTGTNWTVIDQVKKNDIEAKNHTAYGYTIDVDAKYKMIRIEIKNSGIMQLADILIFGSPMEL